MMHAKRRFALGAAVVFALGTQTSRAQEGIKRTDLQTHDLSIPGREVVQQMVELQPGAVVARHTHPGEEVSVMLEGELLLEIAGKPLVTLKAGQAFTVPMGAVHGVKSTGSAPAKLLVTYIVEKGKPLRSPAAAASPPGGPDLAAIRAIVEAPISSGKVAGASVVVARQGQNILSESFGKADLELDVPMPAEASFEIGSVTKQFTAAAILLLAERGKLAVDDELTKYLADYPTHGQRITIRHLLTHTSGIRGYTELPEFGDLMPLRKSPDTLVKLFSGQPLDFTPGEQLVYNNSAYFLLGLIIDKVSGQTYADFVKANLFDKVGMPGSYYCSESAIRHHHAHGYDTFANTLIVKRAISHVWPYSAGSLCSTAADLSAWNAALHGGRVLSADSYRAMITPASLNDGTKTRYGFGIGLTAIRGRRAISHGGGINGFLSEVEYYPESGLSIVILLNTAGPVGPGELARDIADVVLGKMTEPTATFGGDLSAFAGTFEGVGRGRPTVVTIAVEGGKLMMKGTGPEPRALVFRSGETFAAAEALVIFEREGGRVVRLRLDTGGGHVLLKRKAGGSD